MRYILIRAPNNETIKVARIIFVWNNKRGEMPQGKYGRGGGAMARSSGGGGGGFEGQEILENEVL